MDPAHNVHRDHGVFTFDTINGTGISIQARPRILTTIGFTDKSWETPHQRAKNLDFS